jgi:hypothetical protein
VAIWPHFFTSLLYHNPLDKQNQRDSVPVAQLAAHRNAWSALHALHALHGCHTGHTLHGTREVGSTVRAECPAQFEQALALGTGTLELLTTGGANLEIRLYASMTVVAGLALGHLCQ